jgi:hypothetical protein
LSYAKAKKPSSSDYKFAKNCQAKQIVLRSSKSLLGENRWLVTGEPVEFETSGGLPIILEESIEYTSHGLPIISGVGKVAAHLCLALIIKELRINVEQDRVVTTLNILKH